MKVAIASGKGGTGKTSVAVNLALSLPGSVQLLDCDADEPNVHTLLPLKHDQLQPVFTMIPDFDNTKCTRSKKCSAFCPTHAIFVSDKGITFFSELCIGCGGCILSCPSKAISEGQRRLGVLHRGITETGIEVIYGELDVGEPFVVPVIKAVKAKAKDSGNTVVIVDCPPGVSCPMVESVHSVDYCLLVTEPTPFGLHDLRLAVDTVRQLNIPIGVIINRAGIGNQQVYTYCASEGIPILLEIPHSRQIAELFSEGTPFVQYMPEWRVRLAELYQIIQEEVE